VVPVPVLVPVLVQVQVQVPVVVVRRRIAYGLLRPPMGCKTAPNAHDP